LAHYRIEREERESRQKVDPKPAFDVITRDLFPGHDQVVSLVYVHPIEVHQNISNKNKSCKILQHFEKQNSLLHEGYFECQEKDDNYQHD
jgi:hypothetical protein